MGIAKIGQPQPNGYLNRDGSVGFCYDPKLISDFKTSYIHLIPAILAGPSITPTSGKIERIGVPPKITYSWPPELGITNRRMAWILPGNCLTLKILILLRGAIAHTSRPYPEGSVCFLSDFNPGRIAKGVILIVQAA
jgi:hypothetical protein